MTPKHHERGVYMSKGGFIYAIGMEGTSSVKIGKTAGSVEKRLAELQTGQPFPLKLLASVQVEDYLGGVESAIHRFLEADRQRGEWFTLAVDQAHLEALILRAIQWLATEELQRTTPLKRTPGSESMKPDSI